MALPSNPTVVVFTVLTGGLTTDLQAIDGRLAALAGQLTANADITFGASREGETPVLVRDSAQATATTRTIVTANTTTTAFFFPLSLNDWIGIPKLRLNFSVAQTVGTKIYGILAGSGV